jgi:nucleoside 2-deoxyribosyltransferase
MRRILGRRAPSTKEAGMRIYLAGPEVFLPDAAVVGERKKARAARHGFAGVFPLDAGAPPGWRAISSANEALIRSCGAVVANLSPFRGPSADPGTAFELGFARALGLPCFGYSASEADLAQRVPMGWRGEDGRLRDQEGLEIEEFGLADNLMLEGAIAASGGAMVRLPAADPWHDLEPFEACLAEMARRLR